MQMFFLLFLISLAGARWTKPNIYNWLEQNSYICYLELRSPHDLRFLNKEEATILKCSCGDPLLTQSACARSNNLRRPFCARLPDLCMKAYTIIFTPSHTKKTETRNSTVETAVNNREVSLNQIQDYTAGGGPSTRYEFFTLAPKVDETTISGAKEMERKSATPGKIFSPIKQIRGFTSTMSTTSSPVTVTSTTTGVLNPPTVHLLDGEVANPHDHHGIEILFNTSHTMDKLMDKLIKKIAEMIKMLSSHEEEAPVQRVVFTETMREDNSTDGEGIVTNEPLVLRPHGVAADETTIPPVVHSSFASTTSSTTARPFKITKTKNPNKKRPIYHEALVKLQKRLLGVLGVNPEDWDYEDEINDNDIITIFRERMDDENDLAFSDDKWSDESEGKDIPFDPRICEDNHSFCSVWTAYRLCHPHARFMYKYCRKSCGICL